MADVDECAVGVDLDSVCRGCGGVSKGAVANDPAWYVLETGKTVWWCYLCAHEHEGTITTVR